MEMDRRRVSRVKIKPLPAAGATVAPPSESAASAKVAAPDAAKISLRAGAVKRTPRENDPLHFAARCCSPFPRFGSSSRWFSCSRISFRAIPCSRCSAKARAPKTCSSCVIRSGWTCPFSAQYGHYLAGVVHGDLGESFRFQQPVTRVVLSHYPATLELAIVALLVCAAIGIPAGLLAAETRGTSTDHAVGVFTLLGLSVPTSRWARC